MKPLKATFIKIWFDFQIGFSSELSWCGRILNFEFLSFFNFWLDVNMYVAGVQLSAWFMRLKSYFTPVLSRSEQSSTFHCQAKNCAIGQLRASFWLVWAGFEILCVTHCKYIQFFIVSTFHCILAVRFTFFAIYSPM